MGSPPKSLAMRKRTRRSREASLLRGIAEASADGVLVISTDGRILSFNKRFLALWQLSRDATVAESDEEALRSALKRVENPDRFLTKVRYLYQHPYEESWDEIDLTDGVCFERYSAPLLARGRLLGRVWFFRDVSARRRAETALANLRNEFLAMVVHDLRSPIQSILFQVNLLLKNANLAAGKGAVSPLHRVERSAVRLAGLVNDLLDMTRIDLKTLVLDPRPLALDDLVHVLVEEIGPGLGRHAVEVRIEGSLPIVSVDRLRFAQILTNLLDNAAKYSPDGAPIEVILAPCDGGATVSVRDHGVGIASADLPRVFDRFFQAQDARAKGLGVGLGLFITKTLVDIHHGRLTVESEPDRGSTFRVCLPASAEPSQPGATTR
jgi:signal transduction histidine kinase